MKTSRWLTLIFFVASCASLPPLISNINLELFDQETDQSQVGFNGFIEADFSFDHGIASGDPTNNSVILWTRIAPHTRNVLVYSVPIFLAISQNSSMEMAAKYTVLTTQLVDFTVKVDVTGLQPNMKYYYQFYSMDGAITQIGSTRTLPKNDDPITEVNFALHSCSDYSGGYFTAYSMPALKGSVDYVIHLGDYIYEYPNGEYTDGSAMNRVPLPDKELYELDDYRQRYAIHKMDVDLQLAHATVPWIVVWDDHELADNSWMRGSVNSHGVEFMNRKRNFVQAYFEWMPIRPQDGVYKIWRHVRFGKLADLFMLDTRHYSRDITDTYDNTDYIASIADRPERTMMGFDQEKWLYSSLNSSDAAWKFVGSQTVVNSVSFKKMREVFNYPTHEKNYDSFDGYTQNRQRFIDSIVNNNIHDVILLSGDFHISWVHEIFAKEDHYDVATGNGSIIVEFAVTGTSAPTSFPEGLTVEQSYAVSEVLVSSNKGVVWNEGWFRGYSEVHVKETEVIVQFFGVDVKNMERKEFLLATFAVDKGTNKVRRSFNKAIKYGYLDKRVE